MAGMSTVNKDKAGNDMTLSD
ncbi:hypothetical protein C355_01943 [Cryptococcus neoformans Th84]|nr:hypothetical protein C344_05143 [Cryptococcus neoformans var. grubii AD1-7a]OXG51916.1 hypothetical protein C355_01943 [Cryptococcus neoformans var. grubii Th84]OXH26414.1 hypothetical protein J009_05245 [Cryptococcus neoformans var. grubii]